MLCQVSPKRGIGDTSFVIRVGNSTLLDYETLKVANFTLVAREEVEDDPKEGRARVTVHVRDHNDNSPPFDRERRVALVFVNVGFFFLFLGKKNLGNRDV